MLRDIGSALKLKEFSNYWHPSLKYYFGNLVIEWMSQPFFHRFDPLKTSNTDETLGRLYSIQYSFSMYLSISTGYMDRYIINKWGIQKSCATFFLKKSSKIKK